MYKYAAVILSLAIDNKKSVGICICYRPTFRGFSHCPLDVGRQRRSPRSYMQSMRPAIFLSKYTAESKKNYISSGIYHCSILDI